VMVGVCNMRWTGSVEIEMRCWANMGVVVARFMVFRRWCSASERGKQSPKINLQSHISRRGCTNLNWYSTPANSNLHVYFDT
jgi:hypothetical protein